MCEKIPLTIIDIEGKGCHILLEASLNGEPLNLVVDTGASTSVFDYSILLKFAIKNKAIDSEILSTAVGSNELETKIVKIKELSFGNLKIMKYNAVLMDLSHINTTYSSAGLPHIDGVLGGDILLRYQAKIDYKTELLSLRKNIKKKK